MVQNLIQSLSCLRGLLLQRFHHTGSPHVPSTTLKSRIPHSQQQGRHRKASAQAKFVVSCVVCAACCMRARRASVCGRCAESVRGGVGEKRGREGLCCKAVFSNELRWVYSVWPCMHTSQSPHSINKCFTLSHEGQPPGQCMKWSLDFCPWEFKRKHRHGASAHTSQQPSPLPLTSNVMLVLHVFP